MKHEQYKDEGAIQDLDLRAQDFVRLQKGQKTVQGLS